MVSGRRKLLLADDSPTVQKVISLTFEDEGFDVVTVGDGAKALAALEADPPDVLLADVHMPGPDGYELCERVRRSERLRHVPVVLLVGSFEPFNEAEARRVGADTFLTKPFQSIRDLVSKVGSLLGGESKHEEAPGETQGAQPPFEQPVRQDDAARQGPYAQAEPFGTHEAEPQAEHAAFADFSADDELIEAKPADSFGVAASRDETPSREHFVSASHDVDAMRPRDTMLADESNESHAHAAETREHDAFAQSQFDLGEPSAAHAQANMEEESQPAPFGASYEAAPSSSFAAAHEVGERVMAARASFNGRSAVASSADDALLDLGQTEPPAPAPPPEADDFILDLDEGFALDAPAQADAPGAFAEAAHGEHASQASEAASVYEEPAPVQDDASPSVATEVVMQDEPQQFARRDEPQGFAPHDEAHAPLGFVEPEVVPADAPVPASVEGEYTDGSVEGDVARPPASLYHTNPTFEASALEQSHEASAAQPAAQENVAAFESPAGQVGESRAGVNEQLRADQLSPEAVEQIARRVVEMMSDKVVREVTWEVVPELAELLIKQWLDKGKLER
ncbi:MAG TPA: response regulator [Pyrinomonadaceae bacterium]|nr:response regulator [Pyrinomonadaceae bacterium]